ncbi:hypothetical protein Awo_c11130 [Acetobacterium woodii DSM 1030]|uniref:Uncharacterized protein n=2 Tax=Acetobacterium woodii TaxID=33952 RepID=H6LD58_ACEWD|nr:hypothetical protein Awo_c11130 [Acetobacterium woodii DSM 1030]
MFIFINEKGEEMQNIQYLTECDLKSIENNSFKVPRFLFSGTYKKISAESKLLFALILERQFYAIEALVNESGYSQELIKKCIKELSKAGLIQMNDSLISSTQLWRTV